MRVILVAAMSKDGFIADSNGNVSSWTSKEDKIFFTEIKEKHALYVMGSRTYDAIQKPLIGDATRVVLTTRRGEYQDEKLDNVIFENLTPKAFVEKYENQYASCLLLGGSKVYTDFLEAKLVDEIYLTIEPILLKRGTLLLKRGQNINSFLPKEVQIKQLNEKGTVLKYYLVS